MVLVSKFRRGARSALPRLAGRIVSYGLTATGGSRGIHFDAFVAAGPTGAVYDAALPIE